MSEDARRALSQKLNYWVDIKVLRAGDFGVPQNRERIFIIGFDKDYFGNKSDFNKLYKWPKPPKLDTKVGDILESQFDLDKIKKDIGKDCYTISDRLWRGHKKRKKEHENKGNGFGYSLFDANSTYTNTISARYYKDGSEVLIDQSAIKKNPRKLTPRECSDFKGFPKSLSLMLYLTDKFINSLVILFALML